MLKTALLFIAVIIMLFTGGCQNDTTVPSSLTPTVGAIFTKPSTPEAIIGEPIVVSSPEIVKTVAVKTPLPEPSVTQGQLLLSTPTPLVDVSTTVLATETSIAATFPAGTPTSEPTLTPILQPITTLTPSAADNSATPTPVLYPTTTWRPPQIAAADVPDDWLTYVDEDAGYSFKYPPEFRLSAGINKGDEFKHVSVEFPPSDEFRPIIGVFVEENADNLTFEQYLVSRYIDCTRRSNIPPEYLATVERIDINGFPSIWSKSDCVSEVFIIISADKKFFGFFVTNGVIVSDLRTVDDASKDTFYQIVNTFTLLPK